MGEIRWGQIIQYRWLLVQRVTFCSNPFQERTQFILLFNFWIWCNLKNCPSCETIALKSSQNPDKTILPIVEPDSSFLCTLVRFSEFIGDNTLVRVLLIFVYRIFLIFVY
jgi:hypothetical protein